MNHLEPLALCDIRPAATPDSPLIATYALLALVFIGALSVALLQPLIPPSAALLLGYPLLIVATRIKTQQDQIQALAVQANTDPLVGIGNRRFLFEQAQIEPRLHLNKQRPAAFLLLDIDHFKTINDRFGHAAGDAVLKAVAGHCLSMARRHSDLAARVGGEEFALILPDTTLEQGLMVAERLRKAVAADTSVASHGQPIHATVSIGVTTMHDGNVEQAFLWADKALYLAKHSGRNRVCEAVGIAT